jgi:hypothetical protein
VGIPPPAYPVTSIHTGVPSRKRGAAGSGGATAIYNVLIYSIVEQLKAVIRNGTVIDSGVAGTDDTDIFVAAVQALPRTMGSIRHRSRNLQSIKANILFYLSNK